MNLARFPRRHYTEYATPLEELTHLTNLLQGPTIYIKRDDVLGLAAGGNKTRKLEFLVADALNEGADTLITCGALQSNHCRLTLAAAAKESQEKTVFELAQATAAHVEIRGIIPRRAITCFDDYVGPGYSIPTPAMVEAVQLLARQEGILLDPVYTGKAMAGLIDLVRQGYFKKDDNILFLHTGGSPALYVYADVLEI